MRSMLPLTLVLTQFDGNEGVSQDDYADPETRSVETVTALRSRLTQRAPAAPEGGGRYRLVWVFAALIVAVASGYLLFPSGPAGGPDHHPPVAKKASPAPALTPKKAEPPAAPEAPGEPAAAGETAAVAPPKAATAQNAPQNQAAAEAEPFPAPPQTASSPAPTLPPPAQAEDKTTPKAFSTPKLTQLVVCRQVNDRQAVGPKTYFSYKLTEKPHVWMTVHARDLPQTLKHIYFHDGRQYVEVPLAIRHPRTRTWSNISLGSADLAGSWRVVVVAENGEELGEAFFEVGP